MSSNGVKTSQQSAAAAACQISRNVSSSSSSATDHHSHTPVKRIKLTSIPVSCSSPSSVPSQSESSISCSSRALDNSQQLASHPPIASTSSSTQSKSTEQVVDEYKRAFNDNCTLAPDEKQKETDKLTAIIEQLKKERPKYFISDQFVKHIKLSCEEITSELVKSRVSRYHRELLLELKRICIKEEKKKDQDEKEKKDKKKMKADKQKTEKQIKKLSATIKELQQQIAEDENKVLDYEQMNNARSTYIEEARMKKKLLACWQKREELLKRSTNSGRWLTRRFHYRGKSCDLPEVIAAVEQLVNKFLQQVEKANQKSSASHQYDNFGLTFLDVRNCIAKIVKEKTLLDKLSSDIYDDVIQEFKNRRSLEQEDVHEILLTLEDLYPETSVNPKDPSLEKEFALNENTFKRRMKEIEEKFVKQQEEMEAKDKNGSIEVVTNKVEMPEWENENELVNDEKGDLVDGRESDANNTEEEELSDEEAEEQAVQEQEKEKQTQAKEESNHQNEDESESSSEEDEEGNSQLDEIQEEDDEEEVVISLVENESESENEMERENSNSNDEIEIITLD